MSMTKTFFIETFGFFGWTRDCRKDGYASLYMEEDKLYNLKGDFSIAHFDGHIKHRTFETNVMMKVK